MTSLLTRFLSSPARQKKKGVWKDTSHYRGKEENNTYTGGKTDKKPKQELRNTGSTSSQMIHQAPFKTLSRAKRHKTDLLWNSPTAPQNQENPKRQDERNDFYVPIPLHFWTGEITCMAYEKRGTVMWFIKKSSPTEPNISSCLILWTSNNIILYIASLLYRPVGDIHCERLLASPWSWRHM